MTSDFGAVHVDIARLDILLNLVGELVINRVTMIALGRKARFKYGFKEQVLELVETTEKIGRISEEIQSKIIKSRLVPIDQVFGRFKKLVDALSENTEKSIVLEIKGRDTEIDKKIIDDLAEPLVHLVRNALDHGIEKIEQRRKAGKSDEGKIILNAFRQGNQLVVEVEDDGAGIDPEQIRRKALELGLYSEKQLNDMDECALTDLLFEGGFSTAEKVTGMSGRGVGMDAARRRIEMLGGRLKVESKKGAGCKSIIRLPMTMAIIQALLVQVGDEIYAIPLEHVQETLRPSPDEINTVENREVMELRGQALSLLRISEALEVEVSESDRQAERLFVVVVRNGEQQIGLVLDRVMGKQEIVIKSMGRRLSGIKGISGASIAGDGNVVMILDVPALCEQAIAEID